MSRPAKVLLALTFSISLAVLTSGCGTEKIRVAKSDPNYQGALLFSQRCSGCHTLSYAATHGSAANVRSAQYNNGPNFDVRCERPITRVLYAIENGGFSGAIMPQNVVIGQQALEVAKFVATYAGRSAPNVPGQPTCQGKPIGSIPAATPSGTAKAVATSKQAVQKNAQSGGKVRGSPKKAGTPNAGLIGSKSGGKKKAAGRTKRKP